MISFPYYESHTEKGYSIILNFAATENYPGTHQSSHYTATLITF